MKRRRKLRHYRLIAEPVSFVVTGATLKRRYGLGASDPAERAKDARSGAERRKRARPPAMRR
jgi:hypothetical protein